MRRKTSAILLSVSALLLVGALVSYLLLSAALPRRAGVAAVPGLDSAVAVELDQHAVPRIRAQSLPDTFRAQGFLHAQERFFQMDLTRRSVAGELAALFGARALPLDREQRIFDLRAQAHDLRERLSDRHLAWIEAYVDGVNAGLADLNARPPEYWLFGAKPEPWTLEDSLLVVFAFYTMLSNNESYELSQAVMRATLPASVYEFLTPSTTRFDRPLLASADDLTAGYLPLPLPREDVYDLRDRPSPDTQQRRIDPPLSGAASNQWAVDARRSLNGHAIVANDPHLRLRLPNVFYRTELEWPGGRALGVSIPGLPGVLLGATDAIAWGATVSNADQADWVVIEVDPNDPNRYLVPGGSEPFERRHHEIRIAGSDAPEQLETLTTRFGPIAAHDWLERPLALHAAWLEDGGADLEILELVFAADSSEAAEVLAAWNGPSLNWVVADAAGSIAWIVNGPLPRRAGFDGSVPESWARGDVGWRGTQPPPRLFGSPDGALFTANNRTLPIEQAQALSRMWMRSTRAHRIAQIFATGKRFDEQTFLTMQLDTQAAAYEQIRALILEIVAADDASTVLQDARRLALTWNGRADADEHAFRLLHAYYLNLLEHALAPLLWPAIEADPGFRYRWPLADEPLRRLLDERPAHLLPRDFADWTSFLREMLSLTLAGFESDQRYAPDAPWGDVNRLAVAHPLAALPVIGRWLRLPADPHPGSMVSLRVAAPDYGAVIRMAVAPADLSSGLLQMAGGQSGHFLSPNFMDQHDAWLNGTPTPFLAGPTQDRYALEPPP